MSIATFESSVVRILAGDPAKRAVAGGGVLLTPQHLLTCAHVVAAALGVKADIAALPAAPVYVDFCLQPEQPLYQTQVIRWLPVRAAAQIGAPDDMAILRLEQPLAKARPARLMAGAAQRGVQLFGFPAYQDGRTTVYKDAGVYLDGVLKGKNARGQVEIHTALGYGSVAGGFSGTPVWDAAADAIVGIVQAIDDYQGNIRVYMIPADAIWQALPAEIVQRQNPYIGLRCFEEKDQARFFGRDAEIQVLRELVTQQRLVALAGVSGSGKSSVVLAGLIPQLKASQDWTAAVLRPKRQPFHELALALLPLRSPTETEPEDKRLARLTQELPTGATSLPALVHVWQRHSRQHLLLVVDQFEELYTQSAPAVQQQFMDCLLRLIQSDVDAVALLTLRADFLNQALAYPPFAEALNGRTRFIGALNAAELQAAIAQPAQQVGLTLEPGLTPQILKDVGLAAGRLPLLQFALAELCQRQTAGRLTHAAYQAMGGVENALANYAEDRFKEFTPEEQKQIERLFVRLVLPGEAQPTRCVAQQADLPPDLAQAWDLVQRLADRRLITTGQVTPDSPPGRGRGGLLGERQALSAKNPPLPLPGGELTVASSSAEELTAAPGQNTAELVHEALITHWERLRVWIRQDEGFRRWQEDVKRDLAVYRQTPRKRTALLTGAKLAQADAMLRARRRDLSAPEQAFIQASVRHKGQQTRLWQGVFVLLLVLLGFAGWQWQEARKQARFALVGKLGSQAMLAAQSPSIVNGSPDQALLLTAQALRINNNSQTQSNLLHTIQTTARIRQVWHGHTSFVCSVAFSPDGRRVVSGSGDNTLILWDAATGQPLGAPWQGHTGWVHSVAFSPDSRRVVSGSTDNTLILWDTATGQPFGTPWQGHRDEVNSVAFSPDGQCVVSGSVDKTLILWDAATGQPLGAPWQGHRGGVSSVAFSPDSRRVVSGSGDKTLILWDATTGQPIGAPWQGHRGGVVSVAFGPDGQRVVSGSGDKTLILWDATTGQPIGAPWQGHRGGVVSVAFGPDGQRVVSGSLDKTLLLWDATGQPLGAPWQGHTNPVLSVAFGPDGQCVVSGSWDNTLILWDAVTEQSLGTPWQGHTEGIDSVVFSPDVQRMVSGSGDNTLILWDAATGQPLGPPWQGHTAWVNSVAFSPDGRRVVSGSEDKTLILWDVAAGQPIGTPWQGHSGAVVSVAFSPDGRRVVSGSEDKTLILWDVAAGQPIGQPWQGHSGTVDSLAFSPDGRRVVSGSYDKTLILWDVATGQPIWKMWQGRHASAVFSVVFSPDGRRVVSGSVEATLSLWDVATGQPIGAPWQGHSGAIVSLAFSPDGRRVVSGSYDGTLILWDAATGQPIGDPWQGHTSVVYSVAFSPDGKYIVSGGYDGIFRWLADPQDWARIACRKANRNLTEWARFIGDLFPYRATCPELPLPAE